jgi:predicted DNA-binding protein
MKSERFQILLEPDQRGRLDRESARTGKPIGALIREAIDARYGDREKRRAAVAGMRSVADRQPEPDPAALDTR